jgi:hypothetical protein
VQILDAERRKAKEEMKKVPFRKKMENFWFYYKIHTIAAVCTIIVLGISLAQCINRIDYDLTVSMYTVAPVNPDSTDELSKIFAEHCLDINGNDSVDVSIVANSGDITQEAMDPVTQGVLTKMRTETMTYVQPAYIMDEAYKNIAWDSIEEAVVAIAEMNLVPEVCEQFNLKEGQKLYWIEFLDRDELKNKDSRLNVFDNAKRITNYLNKASKN